MQRRFKRSSLFVALLAALPAAFASPAAAQDAGAKKWSPYVDFEARWGSQRNTGEGNFFIPLSQTSDTLFFANLRGRLDGTDDREGSVGGGARRMLESGWNIGTYGYWDHRQTATGNSFNQATFGAEALGLDYELRANIYRPFGNATRTIGIADHGEIFAGGLMITTSTQQETALSGFDVEAGWRTPLFEQEDHRQLRLYLAGYRFGSGEDRIDGARLRGEYALTPFQSRLGGIELTLNAGYQHDNARDGQGFGGLRLRVPLGGATTGAGALSAQERRMMAPVIRDIDIVTEARTQVEQAYATATADGQDIVTATSDTLAGSSLAALVSGAGINSTVLLSGDFTGVGQIQLLGGQTLMGEGTLSVRTASGRNATVSLPGASVSGTVAGNTGLIKMSNDSALIGMHVTHLDPASMFYNPYGVEAHGISNARIIGNTVTATSSGGTAIGIRVMDSTNVIVANNVVFAQHPTMNAVAFQIASSSAQAYENTLTANGASASGSYAVFLVNSSGMAPEILPGSVDNVITGRCFLNGAPGTAVGTMYLVGGGTCP